MSHIVDVYIVVVQIRNVNSKNIFLFKNIKLKIVQKYEKKMLFNDCRKRLFDNKI